MKQQDDWRLFKDQINYLYKSMLLHHSYTPASPNNDHDHCEFCMGKFGFDETDLHYGYSTEDNYTWICENCFKDFKKMFKWNVKEGGKDG